MTSWQFYALGSAVFAGLTAVLAKAGVAGLPSNTATLIRTAVILVFLTALVFVRREWVDPLTLPPRSLLFLVLSAFATGLSWICYFRALQLGPASLVAPIDKLSLVVAILLSVLFLGERLSLYQWLGAALISAGTLLMVFK